MKLSACVAALTLGLGAAHGSPVAVAESQSPVPPPPRESTHSDTSQAIRFLNAYGDSVWLGVGNARVGVVGYLGVHNKTWAESLVVVPAWCRTKGTPLAAVLLGQGDGRKAEAVVESLCALPRLPMGSVFGGGAFQACVFEPGFFGSAKQPSMFGWDFKCPTTSTGTVRVIFFVVGKPDSSLGSPLRQPWQESWGRHRSSGDPMPIRSGEFKRCYDLTPDEMLATRRVIGELVVDLGARTVVVPE